MKLETVMGNPKKIANDKDNLLAKAFRRMGKKQRHIVSKMAMDDYFILSTIDHSKNTKTVTLMDDHGNQECDLTDKELTVLLKRGFLLGKDETMCLELDHMRFWINEVYIEEAMNACG